MKDAFKLGIILFLITGICVGLLGTVNQITTPIIEENNKKAEVEAMQKLIEGADNFPEVEGISDEIVKKVFVGKKGNETVGYVLRVEPNGYGGTISILVGVDTTQNVTGVKILSHSETPGFGANAEKPEFINQYIGKTGEIKVVKTTPANDEIQSITGATITSTAVTNAVNVAIQYVGTHQTEWED